MNKVIINLDSLRNNLELIAAMVEKHRASWTVVTKALCGHRETIKALHLLGARCVADSRLDNLRAIDEVAPLEKWYLRLPHLSVIEEVVELSDVSLNSEIDVIGALSREAVRQNKTHYILIMIELGDLREGILPASLIKFYQTVFTLPNIEVLGLGAQLGCLSGAIPNLDQLSQLLLYRELLELKFHHKLPMVSAGSSIHMPLLRQGQIPRGINHFRIGEALFLGTDLVNGGTLQGLRDDVILLQAEIAEIKEKNLIPLGEIGQSTPFETAGMEEHLSPGQRGYRALVTVGQIDTDVSGLIPVNPGHHVAGASSDITVVNLGDNPDNLKVGDTIKFRVNYSAFVRLMNNSYIGKELNPSLGEFKEKFPAHWDLEVPPVLNELEQETSSSQRKIE